MGWFIAGFAVGVAVAIVAESIEYNLDFAYEAN